MTEKKRRKPEDVERDRSSGGSDSDADRTRPSPDTQADGFVTDAEIEAREAESEEDPNDR